VAQAEHGRSAPGFVGADAFEHGRPVVQRMRERADGDLVGVNERAVEPHAFARRCSCDHGHISVVVTAPYAADPTLAAYFAKTPPRKLGSGARQERKRSSITAAGTARSSERASTSMTISSPSRTAASGPPAAASGAACPIINPRVPPLKRPSVTSATLSPKPAPTIAAVTLSISRIPGPPLGPSYAMTTTSPGAIVSSRIACIARSSELKTRAGPRW